MDDSATVSVGERVENVVQYASYLARREAIPPRDSLAQGLALDERHRVPEQVLVLAGTQDGNDVRMVELSDHHDLAPEPIAVHSGRELWFQNLHDNASIERVLDGDEHATHTAASQFTLYPVGRRERRLELIAKGVVNKSHRRCAGSEGG